MIERRLEPRMMCADLVEVRWKDKSDRNRRAVANLEDISESGVCLQMEVEIPLTTVVRIRYSDGEFLGVVQHCDYQEIGYYLGVRFEAGCEWSQSSFKPEHLLDPRELVERAPVRARNRVPRRPV